MGNGNLVFSKNSMKLGYTVFPLRMLWLDVYLSLPTCMAAENKNTITRRDKSLPEPEELMQTLSRPTSLGV